MQTLGPWAYASIISCNNQRGSCFPTICFLKMPYAWHRARTAQTAPPKGPKSGGIPATKPQPDRNLQTDSGTQISILGFMATVTHVMCCCSCKSVGLVCGPCDKKPLQDVCSSKKATPWGVVARCAHGSIFLECSPFNFYPVERPPQNHTHPVP